MFNEQAVVISIFGMRMDVLVRKIETDIAEFAERRRLRLLADSPERL